MRLVVFGVSGGTGRLIAQQAVGHGHEVTAFAEGPVAGLEHPRLRLVVGDLLDAGSVSDAIEGQRGVACAIETGVRSASRLISDGIANVVYGMAVHEVSRLSLVSAAGVFARRDASLPFGLRMRIATNLRSVYDALEETERRIMASDLDWTIVRTYGLWDGPQTGRYRMTRDGSLLPKATRISRADVAAVTLTALETDEYVRRILTVAN